ncbi:MAG: hypothetical protein AAGA54_07995 [Myxococcota bacterium]
MAAITLAATPALASDDTVPIQRPTAKAQPPAYTSSPAPASATPQPAATPQPTAPPQPAATTASAPAFTRSPAPASTRAVEPAPSPRAAAPARTASRSAGSGGALHATHTPEHRERLPHRGFTIDGRIGTAGCQRSLCADSHDAGPGLRLDGFLGGNIRGWLDLGIAGGWGSFSSAVEQDANLLRLYGVEPAQLDAAATAAGSPLGFNPFALQVRSAKLRTARVGPSLRVHLIPRGRGIAYIGSGFGYSTFLADYQTAAGNVSLRFHGLDVPLQAGAGVQISEHIAAVAQFDYMFSSYPVVRFDHPQESLTLPVSFLDTAASASGNSVSDTLPRMWSVGIGLRARI